MDAAPFSILLQNLLVFPSSSPGVVTTKLISGGLALPSCHRSSGCDYDPKIRLANDTQVRKGMSAVLSTELAAYVHELHVDAERPSRQPYGTTASGDSHESEAGALERLEAVLEAGICE